MSSFANSLKSEIARVARKEMKQELLALRKITAAHRSEIAALKRQVKALASTLKTAAKTSGARVKTAPAGDENGARPGIRFSSSRLIALRKKLGISQAQAAALLDVSYQSVHKWEKGDSKPRAAQLQGIALLTKMGKREVHKRLLELE